MLRRAVVEYVRSQSLLPEEISPYIVRYKAFFDMGAIQIDRAEGFTWDAFLNQQLRSTVYTTEVFVKATAVLLG